MAAPSVIGTTGLIEQPGSPLFVQTDVGRTITRTFVFIGSGTPTHPAIGSAYSGLVLKEISDTRNTTNGRRDVVYIYNEPYADLVSVPYSKLSETESEFDSNMISVPIQQHPNYEAAWATEKAGVEDYLDPQPVRRDTDYLTSLSTDTSDVGKRGQNGYSVYWLYTSMVCRKIGVTRSSGGTLYNVFQRVRTYQYARNGWDADIYAWI